MPAPAPELSVVIPTIGRQELLARVLDRLSEQDAPPGSFELIVAADADEAGADSIADGLLGRAYRARATAGERPGASAARNAGVRVAQAPLVLFLDDDILPSPGLVAQHLAWHRRFPEETTAVLGHVGWAKELRVTPFMRWVERALQFDYARITGIDAGWGRFYTANVSVKRALLERAGGFDEERLPFGYEDLDLACRMRDLGLRLVYNRAASAEHLHRMDLEFWRRRVRRIAVAERRFTELHPDVPPHFHRLFSDAACRPRASGRGVRLAPVIPPWVPVLGPRTWASVDAFYTQALAGDFLDAWAEADGIEATGPDLGERLAGSGFGQAPDSRTGARFGRP